MSLASVAKPWKLDTDYTEMCVTPARPTPPTKKKQQKTHSKKRTAHECSLGTVKRFH